jgi:membrane protease YdiL (CAAX protease family)
MDAGRDELLAANDSRALAAWEIISVITSTLVAEWAVLASVGGDSPWLALPVALALALVVYSHRARGETLRDLGWRFDNFGRALALLAPPMLAGTALFALVGWLGFGRPFRPGGGRAGYELLKITVWGVGWGLLQQYVLQAFVNRRAQLLWGRGAASVLLTAAVFALLHLPNPGLTAATFLGGVVWASVYQRAPNLFALALSHAAMTWVLISAFPDSALRGLRVGFKYFN